jgi:hypothetical protein
MVSASTRSHSSTAQSPDWPSRFTGPAGNGRASPKRRRASNWKACACIGLKGQIRYFHLVQLQIGEFTAERRLAAVTLDDAADAFGADIAAKVFRRLFFRGFRTGAENETALPLVFGIQFQHRMAGRAAAGEEIEHDVAGARRLLQQVLDQRQRLGVLKSIGARNIFHSQNARQYHYVVK